MTVDQLRDLLERERAARLRLTCGRSMGSGASSITKMMLNVDRVLLEQRLGY